MKFIGIVSLLVLSSVISNPVYSQPSPKPAVNYRPPLINLVKPNKTELGQFEKLELTIVITATYDNPFDPEEIAIDARFKSPDGHSLNVPGFYYQEYQRTMVGNKEEMKKAMEPCWKIRFTPTQIGNYTYSISIQDKYRIVRSEPQTFKVTASKNKGFIRRSTLAPYYFQTDNGEPYFAIGHNVCWTGAQGTYEYDKYFEKMSSAGENYTRLWMINWNLGLEYPAKLDPEFDGLGRYNLANANRLDYIIDLAEKKGMYIMLCMDSFSNLKSKGDLGKFKDYPYSSTQLGPCNSPEEFFTHQKAKDYYKKRLRYIIARYGYSTHLLAWEFWNEVDLTDNYNPANVEKWHKEMSQYVRELDAHKHLITTSYAGTRGDDKVWEMPEIDIVQSHMYNVLDTAEGVHNWCEQKANQFNKPHIFGEFGLDAGGKMENNDPTGIYLHNGIWSAAMSAGAGTAMSWWWDSYIDPNNLYKVFTGLSKFMQGIPLSRNAFQYLQISSLRNSSESMMETYTDAVIRPSGGWGDNPKTDVFTVSPNGTITEKESVNMFLHGSSKPELQRSQKFAVDYPSNGKFLVHVNQVSQNAILKIKLDGREVYSHEFKPTSGRGEWKEEKYNSEFKIYQNYYDQDYGIDISKGKHTIELSNEGTDWLSMSYLTLTNYVSSNVPNVRIYGLQSQSQAIFWVLNKDHSWYIRAKDLSPTPVKNAVFDLSGMKNGRYKLEWYNTEDNSLVSSWTLTHRTNLMTITIPDVRTDIAAKLNWIGE